MQTHSGAYPPNDCPTVVSTSHLWVKGHISSLRANLRLTFRPLDPSEMTECANLHSEWFPINYHPQFFKDINLTMVSIAAIIKPSDYGGDDSSDVVAGLILFRVTPHHTLQYLRWTYLLSDVHSCYIATLGVIEELRGLGIGRELMNRCRDYCLTDPSRPQFINLHVAAYNSEAIAFYERLGYSKVEHLRRHYLIKGENYDAYVYLLYINGGKAPLITISNAKAALVSLWHLPGRLKEVILG